MIDDQLAFSDHIAKTAGLADLLYLTTRRSSPFFRNMLHNSWLLFCLGWTSAMLSWQVFQPVLWYQTFTINPEHGSKITFFNEPKWMHVTPLFINLLWLRIVARIKLKALMFAYKTTTGSAPLYLNSLLQYFRLMNPLEWTSLYCAVPKRQKNHFHGHVN